MGIGMTILASPSSLADVDAEYPLHRIVAFGRMAFLASQIAVSPFQGKFGMVLKLRRLRKGRLLSVAGFAILPQFTLVRIFMTMAASLLQAQKSLFSFPKQRRFGRRVTILACQFQVTLDEAVSAMPMVIVLPIFHSCRFKAGRIDEFLLSSQVLQMTSGAIPRVGRRHAPVQPDFLSKLLADILVTLQAGIFHVGKK